MYINTISKTSFCYLGLAYATSQDLTMTHAYIGLKFRYASTNNAEGSCHPLIQDPLHCYGIIIIFFSKQFRISHALLYY